MLSKILTLFLFSTSAADFSEQRLFADLKVITSAEHEGRMTLTPGIEKTAKYIESRLRAIGLKPGVKDSYYDNFTWKTGFRATKNNFVTLTSSSGESLSLNLGTDFVPVVGSAMRLVNSNLVYAGYGLKEDGWNDYESVDVKGKIVLVMRGAPAGKPNRNMSAKARTARDLGASGVIFIGKASDDGSDLPPMVRVQSIASSLEIPAAAVSSRFFKTLTGRDFQAARAAKAPSSSALSWKARMVTETEEKSGTAFNLIGVLPGKDPVLKNEYIIIGAHYDHLGYGEVGSRTGADIYHPGADDNGSGTVALLGLVEYFVKRNDNRRTIFFQFYTGEEIGLVGSNSWAERNPEILKTTTAMLNMDMIGTVRQNNIYVFGTSTSDSWEALLKRVKVDQLNLETRAHLRRDSDQASFGRRNIPALFWHSGLTDTYHSEEDLLKLVNVGGVIKVMAAVAQTAIELDKLPNRLVFNPKADLGQKAEDRRVPPPANGSADSGMVLYSGSQRR